MKNRFLVLLCLLSCHYCLLAQTDWLFTSSPTSQTLNDVAVINKDIIYAVGNNGTIIKSIDGGESFVQQNFLTGFHLYAVAAIDEDQVWVVGENSFIYQTNDGGASWYGEQQDYAATFTDVYFIDDQRGFIAYDDAEDDDRLNILYTENGGGRWEKANLPTTLELPTGMTDVTSFAFQTKMDFPTPEVGYICFSNGILKSIDSGRNWNFQSVTSENNFELTGSFPVALDFMDEERGIIVSPFQPAIGFTQDGATSVAVPTENYGGYDVVYLNEMNAYIVGDVEYAIHHAANNGTVISTPFTDIQNTVDSTRRFYAIDFYQDSLGIAVGSEGRVARFAVPEKEVVNSTAALHTQQVFNMHPNPAVAGENVQVEIPTDFVGQLQIINLQGQVIVTKNITKGTTIIDLITMPLANGTYSILLKDNLTVYQQKLVIL